ncbi:L-lactate dehydrogenase [Pyrenophora tritici-repentis]|nr:L-lactate dehydrogenase [Pyrenophora tritici-repentis]
MPQHPKHTSQIAILGAGDVGATIAYSLIMNPAAGDILMVDPKEEVRDAQVQDLSDATFHGNTSTRIRAGTHEEAGQCDIVVIAAGAKQKKGEPQTHLQVTHNEIANLTHTGESRTDLIGRNKAILESAISDMKTFRADTVLLIVANPVDILTFFAQKFSGLPKQQVIGSGTFLDSARLRGILASKAEVAASSIEAYVLGEHGESQFVAWSLASIGGVALEKAMPSDTKGIDKEAIEEETRNKASSIIQNKGATNYGIGGVAASICKSVLFDEKIIRPVSCWQAGLGVCLSVPVVLGRKGVVRVLDVKLNDEEKGKLEKSAKALREVIEA